MSALLPMFGILVVVQSLFSFHLLVAQVTNVSKSVRKVQGFNMVTYVPSVEASLLTDCTHELML